MINIKFKRYSSKVLCVLDSLKGSQIKDKFVFQKKSRINVRDCFYSAAGISSFGSTDKASTVT
jgi:hypothetical protein